MARMDRHWLLLPLALLGGAQETAATRSPTLKRPAPVTATIIRPDDDFIIVSGSREPTPTTARPGLRIGTRTLLDARLLAAARTGGSDANR